MTDKEKLDAIKALVADENVPRDYLIGSLVDILAKKKENSGEKS